MKVKVLSALVVIKVIVMVVWLGMGLVWAPDSAVAESAAPHAEASSVETAKSTYTAGPGTVPDGVEKGLLDAIKRRTEELDAREDSLRAREDRLNTLSRDVEARVGELKKMLAEYDATVKKLEEANTARIKKTVKIYESMEPEEAATRLEQLTEPTAVLILSGMNPKKAGAVLGLVEVEKAVKLTQLLKLKK